MTSGSGGGRSILEEWGPQAHARPALEEVPSLHQAGNMPFKFNHVDCQSKQSDPAVLMR